MTKYHELTQDQAELESLKELKVTRYHVKKNDLLLVRGHWLKVTWVWGGSVYADDSAAPFKFDWARHMTTMVWVKRVVA